MDNLFKPDNKLYWFNIDLNKQLIINIRDNNTKCLTRYKNEISLFYNNNNKDNPWNNITSKVFLFNKVTDNKKKINRAYFKINEILQHFKIRIKTALCLCEAPGGFVQALCNNNHNIKWTAISIPNNIQFSHTLKNYRNGSVVYKDIINDKIELNYKVDIVTADGGFDTSCSYDSQEILSIELIKCEIEIACNHLKENGILIVKMFDINTDESKELIIKMYTLFERVNICKPPCSKPINSEKYIVCFGYTSKGIKRTNDEIKNLKQIINYINYYSCEMQIYYLKLCLDELWDYSELNISKYKQLQDFYKLKYDNVYY